MQVIIVKNKKNRNSQIECDFYNKQFRVVFLKSV